MNVFQTLRSTSTQSFLKEMFSQSFIDNLKQEISQKVKPSKSILQALKHSTALNKKYQQQIKQLQQLNQQLRVQISHKKPKTLLIQSNKKNNIQVVQQSQTEQKVAQNQNQLYQFSSQIIECQETPNIQKIKSKLLCLTYNRLFQIKIQPQQYLDSTLQVFILQENIKHLQQQKQLREKRYNDLVQREAQYVSELDLFKLKNKNLLKQLQQLKSKWRDEGQDWANKMLQQGERGLADYINMQEQEKKQLEFEQIPLAQLGIQSGVHQIMSQTKTLQICQKYDIQKNLNKGKRDSFQLLNTIDRIISEGIKQENDGEIQLYSETEVVNTVNVNSSQVKIDF